NYKDLQFDRVGYFDDVDVNEDGKVSRDEYLAYNSDSRRYDRDWREDHWKEMIEKFDYNEDDQITTGEVEEYVNERLAEVSEKLKGMKWFGDGDFDFGMDGKDFVFDFDGHDFHGDFDDGEFALHMEEKMEGVQERIEEAMERLEEMDFGDFGDHHVFTFRSSPRFEINRGNWSVHEDLDANEDGEISEEEFLNARSKLFDRLDENGDGVLDEDEMDDLGFHGNFVFDWNDDEDDD
ncbi:MAG: hypothetical protein V3R64_09385, partial [Sphingomonadales bacterium]